MVGSVRGASVREKNITTLEILLNKKTEKTADKHSKHPGILG